MKPTVCLLALFTLLNLNQTSAGQTSDTGWETRPKVTAAIDVLPRTRFQNWVEPQHGVDFSFQRWRTGAIVSHRMKPILKTHPEEIDEEKEYYLVFGGGYEYLHTVQNGKTMIEDRVIVEATQHLVLAGLMLGDRNRGEFRWVNGAYDFRYRNKLVISKPFETSFGFTPYGSGELYYDRNHHSWNQSQYGFGVQFPYKKLLMLDTYLLHQNCTSCSQNPVNMLGITLNFYFRQSPMSKRS
jgi:hypothetical protein